jgi:osomolarity two-component system, response regulator SSK1
MLTTASRGDVLEIGLRLSLGSLSAPQSQRIVEQDGTMALTFELLHRSLLRAPEHDDTAPDHTLPSNLRTSTLRNLLKSLGAELRVDQAARGAYLYRKYDFLAQVKPGKQVLTAHTPPKEEEAMRQPFPDFRLAREPSVGELLEFATTLKGQKATFHASTKSSFAHYLTIYLTGWGMDVTHMPSDSGLSTPPLVEDQTPVTEADSAPLATSGSPPTVEDTLKASVENAPAAVVAPFTIIDDDINVLKAKLSELQIPLFQALQEGRFKRPSLAAHYRPKSSSLIRRAIPQTTATAKQPFSSVIVYFTSLSGYREVKDVIQAILMPRVERGPEIIVIPKPAGVRRFLTALYTAVTKPMVDPVFFSPIATSPMSPNGLTMPPFSTPGVQSPRPTASPLPSHDLASDLVTTPFSSGTPTPVQTMPTSPVGSGGYFEREGKKMAGSASSGLFVKSPDGRTGIFFQPLALRGNSDNRGVESTEVPGKLAEASDIPITHENSPAMVPEASTIKDRDESIVSPSVQSHVTSIPSAPMSPPAASTPLSVPLGDVNGIMGDPVFDRGPIVVKPTKPTKASIVGAKVKKQTDVVVPPISVLIVEGG